MNRRFSKEIESSQDRCALMENQGFAKSAFDIQGPIAQRLVKKVLFTNYPGDFVYGTAAYQELRMVTLAELAQGRVPSVREVDPNHVGSWRHNRPYCLVRQIKHALNHIALRGMYCARLFTLLEDVM